MHVMIDATSAFGATGVGVYGRSLIDSLLALDESVDYTLLFMGNVGQAPAEWRAKARVIGSNRPLIRKFVCGCGSFLPLWPRGWPSDFDVYHSLEQWMPAYAASRGVVTIHHIGSEGLKSAIMSWGMRRARRVIAISSFTRQQIVASGFGARNVAVVHHGTPRRVEPCSDGLDVSEPYVLYVGGLNVSTRHVVGLARAYARIRKSSCARLRLLLAGPIEIHFSKAIELIREAAAGEPVEHLGFVSTEQKAFLMSRAAVFVFPSLLDGFGLPVLEAMSYGCPVITSPLSACAEVAGDAALLVDPRDVDALAKALLRVLHEPGLREDMVARGLQRAHAFTWGRAAEETLAVYREVACSRG